MRKVPMRLGPLALLLTVISICLTTLATLTLTTARGNLALAERFADTVQIRYELEDKGQTYLKETQESGREETAHTVIEHEGYTLTIDLAKNGNDYAVKLWRMEKIWQEDQTIKDLWQTDN